MEIYKKIKNISAWTIIAIALVFLHLIPQIADAGSSFTFSLFQQLVGTGIVPTSPSQSYATQLNTPAVNAASTTGSLTGGSLNIRVVATTAFGTSSPSNEVATTTSVNEGLQLTWPTVPGANAYAIYIGTSTPGSEQAYFEATSTAGVVNSYYSLTSTSTPTYNALALSGAGFYSAFGSASSTIITSGLIQTVSTATTTPCTTALNGSIFYSSSNSHLWLCTGGGPTWKLII